MYHCTYIGRETRSKISRLDSNKHIGLLSTILYNIIYTLKYYTLLYYSIRYTYIHTSHSEFEDRLPTEYHCIHKIFTVADVSI